MSTSEILFSFKGRIGRSTFWIYSIGSSVVGFIGGFILGLLMASKSSPVAVIGVILYIVFILALAWVGLAIAVKRWHDRGKAWYWIFITVIPFIGGLWEFIELGFLPGTPGPNAHGPSSN